MNIYYPILLTSSDTTKTDTSKIQLDTIVDTSSNTISKLQNNTKLNFSKIDSIIKLSEQHDKEIESKESSAAKPIIIPQKKTTKIDTNLLIYEDIGTWQHTEKGLSNAYNENVFFNFRCLKQNAVNKPKRVLISTSTVEAKNDIEKIKKSSNIQFDWISIILLISLIIISWIRLFNKKYFFSVIKSAFIYQHSSAILKEKNSLTGRVSFAFNLVYFLSLSLFLFQVFDFFKINIYPNNPTHLYLFIVGFLLSLNIYRFITSKLIAFLFIKEKIFNEYYYNLSLYNKNIGLFIVPFVVLYRFLQLNNYKLVIYSGLIFIAFYLFLFIIRSFKIIIRNNVSIFYIILYLCTFEIVPILIIIKLLFLNN
jgi:hypothetical protein